MAKKRLFQFSLRTMLVLFLVAGICGGVWNQLIAPVRQQWAAIEPILDMGGRVETKPSNIPEWLKFLLPEGKTENIEAVYFQCPITAEEYTTGVIQFQYATDEAIEALEHLPHLRHLNLEQAQLKSKHIDTIVKLAQLEHLEMAQNRDLTEADLSKLACLENLSFLDISYCGGDWRTLLAFRKNLGIQIRHSVSQEAISSITSADIDDRLAIKHLLALSRHDSPTMKGADASILEKVRLLAPKSETLAVELTDEIDLAFLREFRRLNHEKTFKLDLRPDSASDMADKRMNGAIGLVWKEFGSIGNDLIVSTVGGSPATNHFIFRSTAQTEAFEIDVSFNKDLELSSNLIEELHDLPNIQLFVFNCYGENQIQLARMESLLYKIPNVTEVKTRRPGNNLQAFWRPLSQMKNVQRFSIKATRLGASDAFPKNFPNDFELRDTLTHFTMDVYYPKENEIKNLIKALPNLESFKHLGKEMLKPD